MKNEKHVTSIKIVLPTKEWAYETDHVYDKVRVVRIRFL